MQFPAKYFDGLRAHPQEVMVNWMMDGQRCEISAVHPIAQNQTPVLVSCATDAIRVPERFAHQPWKLLLPQGQTLLVDEGHLPLSVDLASRQAGSVPYRMHRSWPMVWVCVLMLMAFMSWFNWQGAHQMSQALLPWIPQQFDQKLGEAAFRQFDGTRLKPSTVPVTRQNSLRDRFLKLTQAQYPGLKLRLEFRTTGRGADVNAFALPDGTIVLLDGLTKQLSDDGVMAVLGHEMGHVLHRHSVRSVFQSVGLLAAASVMLGDGSSIMSTFAAAVGGARFSRADETQADRVGMEFIQRAGIPLEAWVGVLRTFAALEIGRGEHPVPLLSTHPATRERLEAAETALQAASVR